MLIRVRIPVGEPLKQRAYLHTGKFMRTPAYGEFLISCGDWRLI